MEKILLAVGYRQLEDYLQNQLKKEFLFVGETVYREGIIRAIGQKNPDIVIIRETLSGTENIMKIVYEIRTRYPKTRIIFIAGKREPGDVLLANLVNYGIYDILQGENIPANEIIALVRKPNEHKDVRHFQPVPILDETKNQMVFQAPEIVEKETVREVYKGNGVKDTPQFKGSHEEEPQIKPKTTMVEEIEPTKVETPQTNPFTTKIVTPIKKEIEKQPVETHTDRNSGVVTHKDEPIKKHESKKGRLFSIMKGSQNEIQEKEPQIDVEKENKVKEEKPIEQKGKVGFMFGQQPIHANQKIITFIGGTNGVGTTSLALNTAVALAKNGSKVLFMEFSKTKPRVNYWYDLGLSTEGIDTCMKYLDTNRYEKISKAIISSKDLKKQKCDMQGNYKKFPDKLDFMFYSKEYLLETKEDINMSLSKELYLYLLFQKGYDFVILDMPCDLGNQATLNALIYSNKIFSVVTQDVSSVGYHLYQMNELKKKGIEVFSKTSYIVNKYEKAEINLKDIQEWIGVDSVLSVPMANKDFINANYRGVPFYLCTKNNEVKNAIDTIIRYI